MYATVRCGKILTLLLGDYLRARSTSPEISSPDPAPESDRWNRNSGVVMIIYRIYTIDPDGHVANIEVAEWQTIRKSSKRR